jgi:hypothetical protein
MKDAFNYESVTNSGMNNNSAFGSGGSMANPMYQQVCCNGEYTRNTMRGINRSKAKSRGKCISKQKGFWQL